MTATLTVKDISPKDTNRFWAKIEVRGPDDCWLWKAGKTCGYGSFGISGKQYRAHRIALILNGITFGYGLCACHTCDVPTCCNPAHLFTGTQAENMADRNRKERTSHASVNVGVNHCRAILSDENVKEILTLNGKLTQAEIGRRFGVCRHTVGKILTGKNWKHITQEEVQK